MRAASYSLFLLFWPLMSLMVTTSTTQDFITATQSLLDGPDGNTLVSPGGNFVLGFFSPGPSGSNTRRYVGIWFSGIPDTVVWVANRDSPLLDSSGVLRVTNQSTLILVNSTGGVAWSTNNTNSSRSLSTPVAQLLDSGNLLVRNQGDNNRWWQSFDYPYNSLLQRMRLGMDLDTGFNRFLTSWKSSDDPSPGIYTYRIDPQGYPQLFLYNRSVVQFRDGSWNGGWFSGAPIPIRSQLYRFVSNSIEVYYEYDLFNTAFTILDPYGNIQPREWNNLTQVWDIVSSKPVDKCDSYGVCGVFSSCSLARNLEPQCQCLTGFVPIRPPEWDAGNWTGGCVRSDVLNCSVSDGFNIHPNVKLPDTRYASYNATLTLDECRSRCLRNCTCVAYANLYVTNGGSGCLLWFGTVIDVKANTENGQDLYVRVSSSELDGERNNQVWIVAVSSTLAAMVLCGVTFFIQRRRRRMRRRKREDILRVLKEKQKASREFSINDNKGEFELPIYAFDVIAQATNNFSISSKLGEGGFGLVYKGILSNGQEIAVKRLSQNSRQGPDEFRNEVNFIAKLQHRNLVNLIGCCTEAEEWLLIYEYMPKKSLDCYIFDPTSNNGFLDWPMRLEIIKGIARGLLYLHQDSRLRIVHRDLKASNILLDSEMNPKISDFGLARTFIGNEDEAETKRVVGTYGYMPPEYTIDGRFSVKSDVFSYGVLVLEIISGKKNRGFSHPDHQHNLLGHVWMLFRKGTSLDVVDPSVRNSGCELQMRRSIHIGLLCVQEYPEDRPSMSQVHVMLSSDCELPEPKQPGFYVGRKFPQEPDSGNTQSCSNGATITMLDGR